MNYIEALNNEFKKMGSNKRIVSMPEEKLATTESLLKLDREISAKIRANDAMRIRSMQK